MSEPNIQDLLKRVEAAEKRAADAETLAAAAVKASSGGDTVAQVEARLESQESINRRYAENRARNLDVLKHGMPDSRFRALARGETGSGTTADLRQIIREEIAAMVSEEAPPKPAELKAAPPATGRDARR